MIEVRPYLDPSWVVAVRDAQSPPHDNDAIVGRLAQDTVYGLPQSEASSLITELLVGVLPCGPLSGWPSSITVPSCLLPFGCSQSFGLTNRCRGLNCYLARPGLHENPTEGVANESAHEST